MRRKLKPEDTEKIKEAQADLEGEYESAIEDRIYELSQILKLKESLVRAVWFGYED